jgi:hypothetical protein
MLSREAINVCIYIYEGQDGSGVLLSLLIKFSRNGAHKSRWEDINFKFSGFFSGSREITQN